MLSKPLTPSLDTEFLRYGGSIAERLRARDWRGSPLGTPEQWPASLKTLMATILPAQAQIVLFWGPQYVALYNEAYVPTIGAKHPHALGSPACEYWSEMWHDLEPLLRGVRETGQTYCAKDRPFYIERSGHGETAFFDISYSAVRESDGSVGGVLCIVTETTERVHFEQRQAFLLELGSALRDATQAQSIERIVVSCLAEQFQACRVFYAQDAGDGRSFRVIREHAGNAHELGSVQAYHDVDDELPKRLAGGHAYTANGLYIPVLRPGRPLEFLAVQHQAPHWFAAHEVLLVEEVAKLTWSSLEHARAEATLRASSAQLSAMFDQASAGIAVCDLRGRFVRVNDEFCRIVGRSRDALLATNMQTITHLEDLTTCLARYRQAISERASFEITKRYLRPDGAVVWVQNHVTPLLDESNEASSHMLCVSVDITARMHAQAALKALNEGLEERVEAMVAERETAIAQLHEARKMKTVGQLTGGIAHDFNNLLTPIMASLELIQRRQPDERSARLIEGALQSADRARVLVGRLLAFARRQVLKPRAVALEELITDLGDLIEGALGTSITFAKRIEAGLPQVMVDPHQLELAILNLAVNARDSMSEGGQLTLSATLDVVAAHTASAIAPGRYVRLDVADTGTGMEPDVLARCVEPFFTTKGVGKGTGLGLSMVQGLAVQSGGGFDITSSAGEGTAVHLWLPLAVRC